ncbi:ricin-type beta-trefoil lectin domain protein [Streptomyces sp. NPDC016562]|uniref:ricin-type beta-trefoil lectin domain protein n=1 Tax=Streptomyces sp. NPDC016562 TaxID=3364966 RepID=UPI0036FE0226
MKPALTALQQGIVDARAKAKSTGKPVVVDAMTTETSLTVINPDGTASTTDNTHAVRTKRGKAWAQLDATLRKNSDGTLSPAVGAVGLTISGGGSGPMATITTADGKKLAVSAPFALPAPVLDGASATYPNVLPDVDLKVTALATGGWRDVIVVKTAEAATDPRLRTLHFPIAADGLTVSTDSAGNISLKDADGKVRMHAPTPLQWDSTPAAPTPKTGSTFTRGVSPAAAPGVTAPDPALEGSTADRPGPGAKESRIAVRADEHGIDLTPDLAVLGKGTGPWYIDPSISADSGASHSAQVQEYHPNTSYYDAISSLGTGYCGYSDCTGYGRERAYFTININPAIYTQPSGAPAPPTVYGSTLYASVDGASSGTNTPLGLYWSGPISNGVTWYTQPCNGGGTFGGCSKVGGSAWISGIGPIAFDVSAQMKQAASQKWANWTVGIAPDDENNKYYRHHIHNNPHITTNYDLQPSIWYPRTSPASGFANADTKGNRASYDCTSGGAQPWTNPGWIGANQNVVLSANNWSPAGMNLWTNFRMWDDNESANGWSGRTAWQGNYNTAQVAVPASVLKDGHQFGWTANAYDADPVANGLGSVDSSWCYFRVDRTAPTVSVSSAQFPPSGSPAPTPVVYANQQGTFTLGGADPVPAGGAASGLACFKVSTSSTPVTGWGCNDAGVVLPDAATGVGTYKYTPGTWGTNTLYVQAQDNAGNYSQPYAYNFYAPWNPASSPMFGDVTGDGKPDITVPDGTGNLRVVQNTGDPANAGWIGGPAATSPTGTWNGLQITHRASLRGQVPVDDLIVHEPGSPQMLLYTNDGRGNYTQRTPFYPNGTTQAQVTCVDTAGQPVAAGQPGSCPAGVGWDWSQVSQVLAIGTPDGETTSPLSKTSLAVVINGALWLIPPGSGAAVLLKKTETQISSLPWDGSNNTDGYDLIGPGPANGTSAWTLNGTGYTAKQATLWARNRKTGQILAYPITKNATTGATDYTALADPTKGAVLATGVDTATYPVVGSVGDFDGDGVADLYAQTADGRIVVKPGVTGDPANRPGVVTALAASTTVGDPRGPLGRFPLAGPTSTTDTTHTPDLTGRNPATIKGDVTFAPASLGGAATSAAVFNAAAGTQNNGEVGSGLRVDTGKSFTVSAWARADQLTDGVVLSQDGTSTSNFMIWPATFSPGVTNWTFAMSRTDSGWEYDHTNPVGNVEGKANAAARVQQGAWTKLTASFDATTGQMALYVNGALASTGVHTTAMAPTGSLVVGRYFNGGKGSNPFKGAVADVAVYPFATVPGSTAGQLVSGMSPTKCLDESGGAATPGAKVQVWDCNGSTAQKWTFRADGTVGLPFGGCMDATNSGRDNGTPIQWNTCWGTAQTNPAQQFLPRADGSLYNPVSRRCVDIPNGNTTNGTQVVLWDCNGSPTNQYWGLTPNS